MVFLIYTMLTTLQNAWIPYRALNGPKTECFKKLSRMGHSFCQHTWQNNIDIGGGAWHVIRRLKLMTIWAVLTIQVHP